jgi:glutaredoxin
MPKIMMYTLSTCPWCMKTKRFFKEKKVPFDYIDYDLADDATQEKIRKELASRGLNIAFPCVKIDDEVVSGYSPEKYDAILRKKMK